jgi:hypothetical protein
MNAVREDAVIWPPTYIEGDEDLSMQLTGADWNKLLQRVEQLEQVQASLLESSSRASIVS